MTTEDTVHAVVDSYPYGAEAFWRAWATGRLDPHVCDYVRRQAAEAGWGGDLAVAEAALERTQADGSVSQALRRIAAEAVAVAAKSSGAFTAQAGGTPYDVAELRETVRAALFELLYQELDLVRPADGSEAEAGTKLIRHLFRELVHDDDPETLPSFQDLIDWVDNLRYGAGHPDRSPSELWLEQFASCYLRRRQDDPDEYRYQPSFRLFIRSRLKRFCVQEGWEPRPVESGGRYRSVDEAFSALTRERIGLVLESIGLFSEWLAADSLEVA